MTLRKKILIPMGIILIALIAILYMTARFITLRSIDEIERRNLRTNVVRAVSALSENLANLGSFNADWAVWDDTYQFIEDRNEKYIKTNLVNGTFSELRLNFMVFVNSSGLIAFHKGFDLRNNKEITVSKSLLEHISAHQFLLRHSDIAAKKGIILLPEGPALISSHPMVSSDERRPIRGSLIMGRYLDSKLIEHIRETTHQPLTIHLLKDPQIPSDVSATLASSRKESLILTSPSNKHSLVGYALCDDIFGKPALIARVDMPRDIYEKGKEGLSYYLWSLVGVGLVFIVITFLMLEKLILSRLANLHENVDSIRTSEDLSKRVLMTGKDELSKLAGGVNAMLDSIQDSQQSLRDSEERYRSLVEAAPDIIFTLSPEGGRITSLNPAFEAATGLSLTEWIGRPFADIVHPDDVALFNNMFRRVSSGEAPTRFELRISNESREYGTADFVAAPEIKNGKIFRIFGIARDITNHKRAQEALRESEKKLRYLSSHLLTTQERERKRISLELHDELGQALTVLKLKVRSIEKNLRNNQTALREDCEGILQYIDQIIDNTRRLSHDLTPSAIEDLGLSAALGKMVDDLTGHLNTETSLDIADVNQLFPEEEQITIYRIIQEALTNIIKHAQATHISIAIKKHENIVSFIVEDNGRGFDVRQVLCSNEIKKGLGLAAMDERARMLGGFLDIRSQEKAGTRITISVPTSAGGNR